MKYNPRTKLFEFETVEPPKPPLARRVADGFVFLAERFFKNLGETVVLMIHLAFPLACLSIAYYFWSLS